MKRLTFLLVPIALAVLFSCIVSKADECLPYGIEVGADPKSAVEAFHEATGGTMILDQVDRENDRFTFYEFVGPPGGLSGRVMLIFKDDGYHGYHGALVSSEPNDIKIMQTAAQNLLNIEEKCDSVLRRIPQGGGLPDIYFSERRDAFERYGRYIKFSAGGRGAVVLEVVYGPAKLLASQLGVWFDGAGSI